VLNDLRYKPVGTVKDIRAKLESLVARYSLGYSLVPDTELRVN